MSDLTNVFTDIADAIRAKTETQITYKPTEMADAINNISGGGGALEVTTGRVVSSFNMPVNVPDSVTDILRCFMGCEHFDQPLNIPNTVTNMVQCFVNCYKFNQPITIPNGVTNAYQMFANCSNFNQPITIPNGVTNVYQMFANCSNFNQPITIPNGATNAYLMFTGCSNFNQPVIIPNGVTYIASMFSNCLNFGSNIYSYTNIQKTATRNIFRYCNNSLAKHIFTNNTNAFNGTALSESVTGTAITWTQDGDNFYNTDFNIYIHNVANPYTVLNNESYYFDSQPSLPDSPAIVFGSGVRNLRSAFSSISLNSDNTLILFEEGVEDLSRCFVTQSKFNQPLTIPSSAVNCQEILSGCSNFNSPVVFRNGVEDISFALTSCSNFKADLWIPESVTSMSFLLGDVPYASGTVHISHNIALGDTNNNIYNSLVNGYIGITLDPSRILNDY